MTSQLPQGNPLSAADGAQNQIPEIDDDPWGHSPSSAAAWIERINSHADGDELDTDDDGWVRSVPAHRQVETSRGLMIDAGITELLEAVWSANIDTVYSCEGGQIGTIDGSRLRDDDTPAYILFPTVDDALAFLHHSATHLDWDDHIVDELQMSLAPPVTELDGRAVLSLFDSDAIRATVRWPIGYTRALTKAWTSDSLY